MKIQKIGIDQLIPYKKNPRISNESVGHVMSSIKEFGFQQPIVVDKQRVVIIGHTRLQAAKNLKYTQVPVIIADHLSSGQVKALRLADNKAGEKSFWDVELLREEIGDLSGLDFDTDMTDFGFESFEINPVFEDPGENEEPEDTPGDEDLPAATRTGDSLKIRFEDVKEKSEAYSILGVDPKKRAIDWNDVKRALNL